MSWDILLIATRTNTEEMPDITPDLVVTHTKQDVLDAMASVGAVMDSNTILLRDATHVSYSVTEDQSGAVFTIHLSISGMRENANALLTALQDRFGGRLYDVANCAFIDLDGTVGSAHMGAM